MTRVTIIYEGINQGFGYIVEPGATEWTEGEEYVIVNNFNFDDVKHLVGKATDVRREENNEITCEVDDELILRHPPNPYSKNPDADPKGDPMVFFAAYTIGVETDPPWKIRVDLSAGDPPRTIKKCVLKAVGRIPHSGANPGATINT
jgi:hypothetical protein